MALPDRLSDWLDADDWLAPPEPVRAPRPSSRADARTAPARGPRPSKRADARPSRPSRRADAAPRSRSQEARRRLRLIRRRRLDLLQDSVLALILAIFVLVLTAGLGVVALLAFPTALLLIASLVWERRRARRRSS